MLAASLAFATILEPCQSPAKVATQIEVLKDKTLRLSVVGSQSERLEMMLPHVLDGQSAKSVRVTVERESRALFRKHCKPADGWSRSAWKRVGNVDYLYSVRRVKGVHELLGYLVYKTRASEVGIKSASPFFTQPWLLDCMKRFPESIKIRKQPGGKTSN